MMKCLCATLRHSSRLVNSYYEKELQSAGVTPAQFETLATLDSLPSLSQLELATRIGLDQTTLSRNLKLLIACRWIERTGSSTDRRQTLYKLTREGKAALQEALPHWRRAHQHMQRLLGDNWEAVWSSLDSLLTVSQK